MRLIMLWLMVALGMVPTAMAQTQVVTPSGAYIPITVPAAVQAGVATPASSSNPLSVVTTGTSPPIKGFGNLAGTGASASLSALTTGPNSAAWPATPAQVYVIASGGTGYVCPLGGTCSSSVGIPIGGIVAGWGFNAPSTNMTVYGANGIIFAATW